MKKISLVIPCFNSELSIGKVVKEIIDEVEASWSYEIVLVNDFSLDSTWEEIIKLCDSNRNIKGISLAKNFGQHSALMAGFREVTGEIVIALDDDGQTPPKELGKLIQKIEEGHDVVYAKYSEKEHSLFRNLGSEVNKKMAEYLIEKPKALYVSSYFAARRFVIDEIIKYDKPFPYVIGLILRTTKNIVNVEVMHNKRETGKSGYNLKKLFSLWFNGFTAFSVKPLRVATIIGVVMGGGGFLFMLYTIINKMLNPHVPIGWSSIMASIMLIGGIILFMLGLIGEYIGRIYICINNSPQYVVKERVTLCLKNEDKEEAK